MRFTIFFVQRLLALREGAFSQSRPTTSLVMNINEHNERELVKLNERLFREYLVNQNTEPFGETALDDFMLVAANGQTETKSQVSSTVSNLSIKHSVVENLHALSEGDTVVLIGRLTIEGTILGRPLPRQLTYMNVFVKGTGGWRLLARSLTPVSDPKAPAR